MKKQRSLVHLVALVATAVAFGRAQTPNPVATWTFPPDAQFVWTGTALSNLARQIERTAWKPAVNTERMRGGVEVYAKVAPAVVVVRTDTGHGTGFFVSADGQILTNHHVIADGLRHDNQKSASYALVHLGRLQQDGGIELRAEPVRAYLLKADPAADLALLKLDAIPAGFAPLPFLQFADVPAKPGVPATIVGHPASGMLWTMRSGQVAAMGRMPADLVDVVMLRLAATKAQRDQVMQELERTPSRRIILTSAGANPGDSGGPVVDESGRVIAVTFAVPSEAGLAKFSYHIHLDEVRAFMKSVPSSAMMLVPDAWDLGPSIALSDATGDGVPDVLLAGTDKPEMLLFDLDNDTPAAARRDVGALVRDRKWDFEFALRAVRSEPTSTAFYDTDNDGTVDLIHTVQDNDHNKNTSFTRTANGSWRVDENVKLTFPSATYLKDTRLGQRLRTLLERK